jgi:nucleotide-binding universal stress UspA family protein
MRDPSKPNDPILLATSGLNDSDAAVGVATHLARATKRPVKVVAVLEPPPLVAGEYGFVVPVQTVWEDRRDALLARVRKQIVEVVGRDPEWTIDIRTGDPPTAIADAAESVDAALIVMGLGQHHLIDRALGSETALHTLRAARTPIFAVPPTYAALPKRAVVGVDFGDSGVGSARGALELLPTLTRMLLVHVAPRWDLQPSAYAQWREEYERGVQPALERVTREIDAPPTVTVTSAIREGKTARELLKAADEDVADVIVVGSRGLGFLDRMLVGSTASGIIRGAQVAVFALPLAALPARTESVAATAEVGA